MNWETRLERAVNAKQFTDEDRTLASLWITCPISEIAHKIVLKDDITKCPKDIYLILDGIFFTKGVEDGDVDLAMNCYKSIQKRVNKLSLTTIN